MLSQLGCIGFPTWLPYSLANNAVPQMLEGWLGQGLGKDVCHLVGGLHVDDSDSAPAYVVPGEVRPHFNVLGPLVEDRVVSHLDASLVVLIDGDGPLGQA